jgi:triacylglycerol lipase
MNLVFAHGFLIPKHLLGMEYFRGVHTAFPNALVSQVPVIAGIETRANALAEQIDKAFPTGPIHIIGHSMGGLDSRFMLNRNIRGLATPGRVASLSTISTPHRGSPIADFLVGSLPGGLGMKALTYRSLKGVLDQLGLDIGALGDLTVASCAKFNATYADVPHIRYFSYAGSQVDSIALQATHLYMKLGGQSDEERTNDGLVTIASARWGQFDESLWATDHFGEMGYNLNMPTLASAFDHLAAYRMIVQRVA